MAEIFTAIALVLVLEGLLPFVSPDSYKKAVTQLLQMPAQSLRIFGLCSMIAGTVLLYIVRHFG